MAKGINYNYEQLNKEQQKVYYAIKQGLLHAWNVIRIDGKYYHLDATFDNTLSKDDTI